MCLCDCVQVKVVDPKTKQCSTLAGTGEAGDTLGPEFNKSRFSEPGGICAGDGGKLLYVADTNNHQVKVLDLASKTVSLVSFENLNKKSSDERVVSKDTKTASSFLLAPLKSKSPNLSSSPSSWIAQTWYLQSLHLLPKPPPCLSQLPGT